MSVRDYSNARGNHHFVADDEPSLTVQTAMVADTRLITNTNKATSGLNYRVPTHFAVIADFYSAATIGQYDRASKELNAIP
jgi:hypothetical protein